MDVRIGDVPVTSLTTKRARSLLGYLILHRDTASTRETLAFVLWPDSSDDQSRTNLRNLLHTLRRAVPAIEGCLSITNRTVEWRHDVPVWVDVDAFRSATEAASSAAPGSDEMVNALRTAAGVYRGDLLEDCYEDWVNEPRRQLRETYVGTLHRLAAALGDRREYSEAVRLGRELVRREPLDEENHRLLMRLHDAAGDRAAAVRAFHECAAVLRRELGIAPSASTQQLHQVIVQGGDPLPTANVAPVANPATIIGREREWAQLAGHWQESEAGRAQFVLVTGEPGVGKTRLIDELATWCGSRDVLICHSRSYSAEGELGWGTVAAWLRTPAVAVSVGRSQPGDMATLSQIVPDLGPAATAADNNPPPDQADGAGGGERRQVFDAAARAILSASKAVLLIVDDAHWCDAASLQFVHYLLRRRPDGRLLVVASARLEEVTEKHALTTLVDGLTLLERVHEIPLRRLTRQQTAALATQLRGAPLDRAATDDLYARTEGNPLFVVETVRAGAVRSNARHSGMPPKLQAVIRARLAQLSEPAHDLLDLAATVGRAFHAGLLRHALDLDDTTVAGGLDELWRRGLIREHDVDAYDFSHGKIREVAYEALGPASRRANHLRIAQGLQRLLGSEAATASGQIAAHYDRAGHADEAVPWYREAATQAQRRSAYAEAVYFLERASELLEAQTTTEGLARRLEVMSALPTAVIGLEGFASDRLAEAQRTAVDLATRLGVEPDKAVLRSMVLSSLCRDAYDEAGAAAERLLTSAQRTGDRGMLVESRYLLGVVSFWSGNLPAARGHFDAVAKGFVPSSHDEHVLRFGHDPRVVCLSRLANTLAFLGFEDEARRTRDSALSLADEVGHPYSRDVALVFAALLAVDLEEYDLARTYAAYLGERADQGGPIGINAWAWPAYIDVLDGRAGTGIAGIRAALASCGDANPAPGFRATLYRLLVAAHAEANDPHGGLAAADEALAAPGTRIWEPEVRRVRATFLAAVGDAKGADGELLRAEEVALLAGQLGPLRQIAATRLRMGPTG